MVLASQLEAILGRAPHEIDQSPIEALRPERILITGAAGSLGTAAARHLHGHGIGVLTTDIAELDVTDAVAVSGFTRKFDPTLILHLAGAKHAPEGETDPLEVTRVNTLGTANVLATGVRTVLASTCKACNPQTAYGASKLIAERMTLNAGGSVARFFNVIETSGNVFEIWERADGPLPVSKCWRYFITRDEAVLLLLHAATHDGRWIIDAGSPQYIPDVAGAAHPGRATVEVPARRGDRLVEPLHADHENLTTAIGPFRRVVSPHD